MTIFNSDYLCLSPNSQTKSRYIYHYSQQAPAICISFGLCDEDLTAEPCKSGDYITKSLSMVPLALDQERETAAVNVIGAIKEYTAQVIDNRISYITCSEKPGGFFILFLFH